MNALKQLANMRKDGNRYGIMQMEKRAKGESVLLGKISNTKKGMVLPMKILQKLIKQKLKKKK
jgi:hypothetical protein